MQEAGEISGKKPKKRRARLDYAANGLSRLKWILPGLFLYASCLDPAWSQTTENQGEAATVSLDLAAGNKPVSHCASGILLALSPTTPPDEYVKPLKLKAFRGWDIPKYPMTPELSQRIRSLGVDHFQMITSDTWHAKYPKAWPGDNGDWTVWQQLVDDYFAKSLTCFEGFEWDVWNEPNGKYFWAR